MTEINEWKNRSICFLLLKILVNYLKKKHFVYQIALKINFFRYFDNEM